VKEAEVEIFLLEAAFEPIVDRAGPDCEAPLGMECAHTGLQTLPTVESVIARGSQSFRTIVHVKQDRVKGVFRLLNQVHHITDFEHDTWITQGMIVEFAEIVPVPLDNLRKQFAHHNGCLGLK
jgi:hypothetical protein